MVDGGEEIVEVQPKRREMEPVVAPSAPAVPAYGGGGGGDGEGDVDVIDVAPKYAGGGGGATYGRASTAPVRIGTNPGKKEPPPPPCITRTQWDEASVRACL